MYKTKLKLVVDVRSLSFRPSGIGLYAYNFILELVNYKNIEITLFTDVIESEQIKNLLSLGIKIISFGKRVRRSFDVFSYYFFIKNRLRLLDVDFFWQPNQIIPIYLKSSIYKTIITIHDLLPLTHWKYHKILFVIYFYFFIKLSIFNTDIILYNSEMTKKITEKIFGSAKSKINHVSYCIIDKPIVNQIDNKDYFLYIGNLEKKKGLDILVLAFSIYRKNGGSKKLILAGNLREKKILININKTNEKYPDSIEYLGYINNDKKHYLLSNCSCFVFPSRAEGFGIPPVEASAYKKPVILSDLEIFSEVMGPNINRFKLGKNTKQASISLAKQMLEYKDIVSDSLNNYSADIRTNFLVKFLIKEKNIEPLD